MRSAAKTTVVPVDNDRIDANAWKALLAPAGGGGFLGDERNVLVALRNAPALLKLVRFNDFAMDVEFTRNPPWRHVTAGDTWAEGDDTQLVAWLQEVGLRVRSKGTAADCVAVAARDHAVHPVREYLDGLKWDRTARCAHWLRDYLGAEGPVEYLSAVGLRFLVSAVARILAPGCQVDSMLVLEGQQGCGKTSVVRALARRPAWFAGHLPALDSKDAPLQLAGRWIVEIAELKAIRATQAEATKSFLTQTVDTFRPPYGRRTGQFPRQCVFVATTNESEYLRDRTGNRRYWPVTCREIDLAALQAICDQLWAEAVHRYRAGEQWHLTDAEAAAATEEQADRVQLTEVESAVLRYLATFSGPEITTREVLTFGLGLDPDRPDFIQRARQIGPEVSEILTQRGWKKQCRRERQGLRETVYRR